MLISPTTPSTAQGGGPFWFSYILNEIVQYNPAGTIKNSDNVKKINIVIPEPPLFISRKALRSSDHNTFTMMLPHLW